MNSVNISILTGRLGKDPEVRHISDDLTVCKLVMATDFSWYSKKKQNDDGSTGGWESETTWHNIVIWKPGKKLQEAKKGHLVHVEGRYRDNNWEDDKGEMHYRKEMVADKHWVLPKAEGNAFATEAEKAAKKKPVEQGGPPEDDSGFPTEAPDDLPF